MPKTKRKNKHLKKSKGKKRYGKKYLTRKEVSKLLSLLSQKNNQANRRKSIPE